MLAHVWADLDYFLQTRKHTHKTQQPSVTSMHFLWFVCLSCCVFYKVKHQKIKHNNDLKLVSAERSLLLELIMVSKHVATACWIQRKLLERQLTLLMHLPTAATSSFQNTRQTHHCYQRSFLLKMSQDGVWYRAKVVFFSIIWTVFYVYPNVSLETSASHRRAEGIRQRHLWLGERGRQRKTAFSWTLSLTHMATNACVI